MGLTKKELKAMINEAVTDVFSNLMEEVKPMIRKTIRQEFYKIVDDAGQHSQQQNVHNELSMKSLIQREETDEITKNIEKKVFNEGRFADILNQTAAQYSGQSLPNDNAVPNDQATFVLNEGGINANDLASKMGYGDGFDKVGSSAKIPGSERPKAKSPLQNILNKQKTQKTETLNQIQLPTKNADGRPINFEKVPANLVQNMMKNYSGLLDKVDKKVKQKRGA